MEELSKRLAELTPEKRALLTLRLKKRRDAEGRNEALPKRTDSDAFPLSFAQQRLWFLEQLAPNNPQYNIPAALHLLGPLDVDALRRSLNTIVQRHETLRARFTAENGLPVQTVLPEMDLPLPVLDLRTTAKEKRLSHAMRIATEEARRPFSLAEGPLMRAGLIRMAEDEHIALLTMHHIVSDGWSISILARELSSLYGAFTGGHRPELPDLPVQYADFAWWQRNRLREDFVENELDFWRERFNGAGSLLDLPADRQRPSVETYRGASLTFDLPSSLYGDLDSMARAMDMSLFMLFLAAFRVLLHRYTGREDICIGTPVANRDRSEFQNLIGLFANTLVMRNDIVGDPTFAELLKEERRVALEAFAHRDLPFEMLVERLRPQRSLSFSPLFQVMLALQENPVRRLELPNLQCELMEIDYGSSKFDITLFVTVEKKRLSGQIEYNSDLFDGPTIARMAGHFQTLLKGIAEDPDRPLSRLSLLQPSEGRQMLLEWNDTAREFVQGLCVHELFEEQVERSPDAVAAVYEDAQLTYRELNRRVNQVAHCLRKRGVGPDTLVGLCMERSLEMVIGLLGVLKAGGAYVPMDPNYPPDRLSLMIEDSGVRIVLTLGGTRDQGREETSETSGIGDQTQPATRDPQPATQRHEETKGQGTRDKEREEMPKQLPPTSNLQPPTILSLDTDWPLIAQEPDANPNVEVDPANLAYVIFTSGSTGRPKGVMIQHASAVHLGEALSTSIYRPRGTTPLRVSLNAPLSFDASVQQLLMLLYGHTLVIIPQETRLDGEALLFFLRRHRMDVLDCVPSQLRLLLSSGMLEEPTPSVVLPGGEAIEETMWQELERAPHTEFFNMYGPTECTVDSTGFRVRREEDRPVIGVPLPNVRFYLLGSRLQPLPSGVPGELHIQGAGTGRGYLNRPELTAEKFIPDPFSGAFGSRLYRTGDLMRYLPNGPLEFLGRIDHQVKLRGFRIELGDIESALKGHAAIQDAVALLREDGTGDKRLVAYVVPRVKGWTGGRELLNFLKGRLPGYMIPSSFVPLERLPLTPNGKLDRSSLPAPEPPRLDETAAHIPPRTPTEEFLATVWKLVLKADHLSVSDDFFDVGGHSLLATQIVSRIRETLKLDIQVREIFQYPNIADLAQRLDAARWASQPTTGSPAATADREEGVL